jgi:peptide deformylase
VAEDVEVEELEEAQHELPPEVRARRAAALAVVRQWGDAALKARARRVERFDDELLAEVERMARLMEDALGIGLAATQLAHLRRLLVYRASPDARVTALVNPELEWRGREEEVAEEGCLSLQGVHVDVERPVHVRVRASDPHGAPLTIEASGLEARVIQHEMDHLDGILILDRTSREQRKEAMRDLRESAESAA